MNKLLPLLLLFAVSAFGANQERIRLTITVTNPPVTSNTLTVNSSTRTWTNAISATTIATNLVSVNLAATNLFNQIAFAPYTGAILPRWLNTNQIELRGPIGGALAASSAGTWATLTLNTQAAAATFTALWPIENMDGATNRTNQASAFVYGLSQFSTQAFATNSTAVSNLLHKGAGTKQVVLTETEFRTLLTAAFASLTNASFYNSTNRGYVVALTNGYWTNGVFDSPYLTNLFAPGSGANSVDISGTASGASSTAVGYASIASGGAAVALGTLAEASSVDATALGTDATASGGGSLAIGAASGAAGSNSIAIGVSSAAADQNSVAIGGFAATTTTNQIILGSADHAVTAPGRFTSSVFTNNTHRGTNVFNGRVDFTSRANTSLANGNNAAVVLGTNVFLRLSGPSAAYVINGFAAEQDGSWHIIEADNPTSSLTIAHQSGTDPTAANRIVTGTGADVVLTNNPAMFEAIYNASAARWRLKGVWR